MVNYFVYNLATVPIKGLLVVVKYCVVKDISYILIKDKRRQQLQLL